jgi:RND family efflux transporter MFP subunit
MRMRIFGKDKTSLWAASLLIAALIVGITGCSRATSAAGPMPPPDVEVATVQQKDVPTYREWIGTLDGMVNAAIRAQVTGYLLSQNYTEGSFVRKGQLLFEIDPRPFQATVDQAQGQLAQANGQLAQAKAQLVQAKAQLTVAEANQHKTQLDEEKYLPLAKQQAVTQQDADNAVQANLASKAQIEASKAQVETASAQIEAALAGVEAAKAAVDTAKVNLGFTHLTSPIDGVVGQALIQVGNLVSPSGSAITTVSTLDPIKADFTVSETEYLNFSKAVSNGLKQLQLELILSDGSEYPQKGRFSFADRQVSSNTGSILLIGLFPNPGGVLRPGQYGKVRAAIGVAHGALLVPQRAVTELQGTYQVAVVDSANKIDIRTVKVGDRSGTMWLITEGLKPGERVVAEGVQKVGPGMQVTPKGR